MAGNIKYDIAKGFQRTNSFPLDNTSVFSSLHDAEVYATGGGNFGKTSYLGQVVAVVENNEVHVYKIGIKKGTAERELQELGGIIDKEILIGGESIPPGTEMSYVLEKINSIITTSDPITVNETTIPEGTPINEALETVVSDLLIKISGAGIKASDLEHDDDISITQGSEEGKVKISIKGISNPDVIVLDKDRYITLEFVGGSVEPITASSVANYVEFEEVIPDTVPSGGVWKVKNKDSRLTTYRIYDNGNPPSETLFFEPGYKIKIDGLNQIDDEEITITFEKV